MADFSRMSDEGKIIEVLPRTGRLYVVPSWGYLTALELRWSPPLMNMDTSMPHRFIIEPEPCASAVSDFQVFAHVRSVRNA